jgi:SPP1 gp7 family putative phage head morphogenesis protein
MVWTTGTPILLEDIVNRKIPEPASGSPPPGSNIETPQDGVESDKTPKPDEVATVVKAELKNWERFAINRLGKKSVRQFETKTIPIAYAKFLNEISTCETTQAVKAIFGVEAAKVAYWEGFVRDTEAFEPKAINELRDMFRAQFKEAIDNLKKMKPGMVMTVDEAAKQLISRDKAIKDYSESMTKICQEALDKAIRQATDRIKPVNPYTVKAIPSFVSAAALKWLEKRILWAAEQVSDETENMLRAQLSVGFDTGESMPQIAKRVQSVFDECDKVRATRIARTEIIAASSQGAVETYRDAGLTQVEVYPAMDELECDLCATLAGVHDISEQYTPPFHPNCRCVLLPVLD